MSEGRIIQTDGRDVDFRIQNRLSENLTTQLYLMRENIVGAPKQNPHWNDNIPIPMGIFTFVVLYFT